jgi:Four helix bundle sensory module for signal transduction
VISIESRPTSATFGFQTRASSANSIISRPISEPPKQPTCFQLAPPISKRAKRKWPSSIDRSIAQVQRGYEILNRSSSEIELYTQFCAHWNRYKEIAGQIVARSLADRKPDAVQAYMTSSRAAYDAASDTLGQLTDFNVSNAREASERADLAYQQARLLIATAMSVAGRIFVCQALAFCAVAEFCHLHAAARH